MFYFDELSSPTNVYGNSDFSAMSSEVPPQLDLVVNSGEHLAGWIIGLIIAGCVLLATAVATVIFLILRYKEKQNPNHNNLNPIASKSLQSTETPQLDEDQDIPTQKNESLQPTKPLWVRLRINLQMEYQSDLACAKRITKLVLSAMFGYWGITDIFEPLSEGDADDIGDYIFGDYILILEDDLISVNENANDIEIARKAIQQLVRDVRNSCTYEGLKEAALNFRRKVGLINLHEQSVLQCAKDNAKIVAEYYREKGFSLSLPNFHTI